MQKRNQIGASPSNELAGVARPHRTLLVGKTMNGQNLTLENNPKTREPDVKVSKENKKALEVRGYWAIHCGHIK